MTWIKSHENYALGNYVQKLTMHMYCRLIDQNHSLSLSSTGEKIWRQMFSSPVVAIYTPELGGELRKVPMTTIARETMGLITETSVLAIRTNTPTDTILK